MLYSNHSAFFAKSLARALVLLLLPALTAALPNLEKLMQLAQARYGVQAAQAVAQWQEVLNKSRGLPEQEQLARINDFFNQKIVFVDDIDAWGKHDYWATPWKAWGAGVATVRTSPLPNTSPCAVWACRSSGCGSPTCAPSGAAFPRRTWCWPITLRRARNR